MIKDWQYRFLPVMLKKIKHGSWHSLSFVSEILIRIHAILSIHFLSIMKLNEKIIIVAVGLIALCAGVFFYMSTDKQSPAERQSQDQIVLEQTYGISKEYVALRYRTDNMLVNARSFTDYAAWRQEIESVMQKWETLEAEEINLEKSAQIMTQEKVSFNIISQARAYDKKEISDVFDNAPAGKKSPLLLSI